MTLSDAPFAAASLAEGISQSELARDPDRARLLMAHHLLAIEDCVHEEDVFEES